MAIETGFRCVPAILDSERVEGEGRVGGHLLKRGACLILCLIWWEVYSGRGAY